MKKTIFALLLAIAATPVFGAADIPHSAETINETLELKILQWNIHAGVNIHGDFNLKRQAEVMKKAKPDIIVLNEVDKNCVRSNYMDMPKVLGKSMGMHAEFAAGRVFPPEGLCGNAVLSRYPMELLGAWLIPNTPHGPSGAMMLVFIKAPNPFYIAAVHLPASRENEEVRVKILQKIVKIINDLAVDYPSVIVGDLNCEGDSDCIRALAKMNWEAGKILPTMPVRSPKRPRDYIVIKVNDKRIELVDRHTLDEKTASDHRPVLNAIRIHRQVTHR